MAPLLGVLEDAAPLLALAVAACIAPPLEDWKARRRAAIAADEIRRITERHR